jgi:pimeloyl-ACP methyl ester carboxylesterase
MATKLERRIDVTEAAGLDQPVELAVTIFLPDPSRLGDQPVAIFAAPGGGYGRGYFDLSFPSHGDYSQADFHASRGIIFVAIDPIGVGESTIPDLSRISFETLAATHDSCARQLVDALELGTLTPDFPACRVLFKVGLGQSMGGGVSILTQGRYETFDAIAPLGVSAIHTTLPQRTQEEVAHGQQRFEEVEVGDTRHSPATVNNDGVDYLYPFHWEDVPADIIEMDMSGGYPLRRTVPPFGSATIPHCAVQMMTPGAFAPDAARVTVPILIGNGERDTCPDPHAEPLAYKASPDISVFTVPTMAHMHNFASTRALLWARIDGWARMLAAANAGEANPAAEEL